MKFYTNNRKRKKEKTQKTRPTKMFLFFSSSCVFFSVVYCFFGCVFLSRSLSYYFMFWLCSFVVAYVFFHSIAMWAACALIHCISNTLQQRPLNVSANEIKSFSKWSKQLNWITHRVDKFYFNRVPIATDGKSLCI